MRIGFLRRGTAAAAPEETVLRRIPDLPPDWVQPPAHHAQRALEDAAAVCAPLEFRSPARAEECGRWKRAKAHDPHSWQHSDHGLVACPGYRPLTEET